MDSSPDSSSFLNDEVKADANASVTASFTLGSPRALLKPVVKGSDETPGY